MKKFIPTHLCAWSSKVGWHLILLQRDKDVFYTHDEYDTGLLPTWAYVDGQLTYLGRVVINPTVTILSLQ